MTAPRSFLLALALASATSLAPSLTKQVHAQAHAAPFTEADLDALLAAHPVDTVAELVPLLPDELRENFTFVYDSRSPLRDRISPDNPRVILFTEDATFIATFVTRGPARDLLETMSFDRTHATFTLRARALPAARRAGVTAEGLESQCGQCHGADPRPIFDSYPLWPGFYGSAQDTFPRDLPSARVEERRYRHFLKTSARLPPYRDLRWVLGSPVSPYSDPRTFSREVTSAPEDELVYQPNTRLGMALTELNRQRIVRQLAAAPGFEAAAPGLTADVLGCQDAAGQALDGEQALGAALEMENRARLVRLGVDPRGSVPRRFQMQELGQTRSLARIDRLARRAGVSRADWSMALEPYALSFYDGVLPAVHDGVTPAGASGEEHFLSEDLAFALLERLSRTRPELARYFRAVPSFPSLGYPFATKLDLPRALGLCAAVAR